METNQMRKLYESEPEKWVVYGAKTLPIKPSWGKKTQWIDEADVICTLVAKKHESIADEVIANPNIEITLDNGMSLMNNDNFFMHYNEDFDYQLKPLIQINSMEEMNELPEAREANETNIPIHRAKKLFSDEYVEGNLIPTRRDGAYILPTLTVIPVKSLQTVYFTKIDPSTLAIHFPDMIDSEGTKIFASLSEDGKGGDRFNADEESDNCMVTVVFKDGYKILFDGWDKTLPLPSIKHYMTYAKVTGIQQ